MKLIKFSDFGLILISIFMAMGLRILPLSNDYSIYNPDWVALTVMFWSIHLPHRFGIGLAWFSGLLTDVLTGKLLGGYALCYALIAWLCLRLHRRLSLFPLYQQALFVLLFLLMSQFLIFWTEIHSGLRIHDYSASRIQDWNYYLPSLSGSLAWPFISILLNWFRYTSKPYSNR